MSIVTVPGEAVGDDAGGVEIGGVGETDACAEGVGDGLTDGVDVGSEEEIGLGGAVLHAARPSTKAVVIQGRIDRFIFGSYSEYHRNNAGLKLGEVCRFSW
jgi:hypothetical protein